MYTDCATLDICYRASSITGIQRESIIEKKEIQTSLLTGDSIDQDVLHTQCLAGDTYSIYATNAKYNVHKLSGTISGTIIESLHNHENPNIIYLLMQSCGKEHRALSVTKTFL